MNFEPSDIVQIVVHPLPYVIGLTAEVLSAHSPEQCVRTHPMLPVLAPGEIWYVVLDVTGTKRMAAHSWLRRADPVPLRSAEREACV